MKTTYVINSDKPYGDKLVMACCNYNIPLAIFPICPDKLEKIGVIIKSQYSCGYHFNYKPPSKEKELYAIDLLSKECSISFSELTAVIDYEAFSSIACAGQKTLIESVQPKGAAVNDIVADFEHHFQQIDCDGKTLIITDPYLFQVDGSTQALLLDLLDKSKASHIIAYYDREGNRTTIEAAVTAKGVSITSKQTADIHDRFWICEETQKGFLSGTSINSLVKRMFMIKLMLPSEVIDVLSNLHP